MCFHNALQYLNFVMYLKVIAAGKTFQPGQLTPHLQITGNNMLKNHQNGISFLILAISIVSIK